ncbi:MAG: hypothetical protein AB1813_09400 [Verrucomicrobiota bacterium]
MKRLCTIAGILLTGCLGLAQGTVSFSNHQGQLVDAPFYDSQGRALEGATFAAQLFFWKPDGGFRAAANPVPFGTNGYFSGGSVVLPGIEECGGAWVQVRAWDARAGDSFAEAAIAGAWTGVSASLFIPRVGSPSRPEACIPAFLIGLKYPGSPVLVQQPHALAVQSGEQATLSVIASSGVQMSYQWFQQAGDRPDGLIIGATNATYITPPLGTNATFWVSVSNSVGSVLSEKATVTVVSTIPRLVVRPGAASPQFELHGSTGNTYRVEYSLDLSQSSWTSLVEISLRVSPFVFTDLNWSNSKTRFYRAVVP